MTAKAIRCCICGARYLLPEGSPVLARLYSTVAVSWQNTHSCTEKKDAT
jgi:hypothetical protein